MMRLRSTKPTDKEDLIDIVQTLMDAVKDGTVVSFACVGLNNANKCFMYCGGIHTNLELQGAIAAYGHWFACTCDAVDSSKPESTA